MSDADETSHPDPMRRPSLDETADVNSASRDIHEDDDPRVLAAVQEYMAAVEAGRRPNRRELLARHPEIATELSACLQGLALVQSAAAEIGRDAGGGGAGGQAADAGHVADELASARPLGDFRLIREVGRGGMGVVYEATQLSLGRRVALKVLPLAGALDPRQLQRFRNEAQAAAQLHHTNIVPVYAVGYERSVHFYAMQFIEGQSLAQVIGELRQSSGRDSSAASPDATINKSGSSAGPRGLTIDEAERREQWRSVVHPKTGSLPLPTDNLSVMFGAKRQSFFQTVARLGMQAAEALDYAHQYGVIHRDVKPANLMLDVHGTLWIADFGLAQLVSENAAGGGLTQPGDMLGTLRYMSPEQASGKAVVLDQRTDVYSLGITLYELLTLERALPGETREQLLYQIDYVDPRPARSIDRAIPPELETILTKATAKDAAERYATARAMADDLRRFLANEPILARPPSLWDKIVKWTRRHKSIAVSAIITLLITTVVALTSTALIARRAEEVRQQRIRADKSLEDARHAVDFFTVAAEDLPKDAQYLRYRQDLLERALKYYQTFIDERQDDPAIEADLRAARTRITTLLSEVSLVDQLFRLFACKDLVVQKDVQTDLGLNADQIAAAREMSKQESLKRRAQKSAATSQPVPAYKRAAEERPKVLGEDITSTTKSLEQVLTGAQFERLREISRQVRGLAAFSDHDVAEALGLTVDQQAFVRQLQDDDRKGPPDGGGHHGPGGPGGMDGGGAHPGPGGHDHPDEFDHAGDADKSQDAGGEPHRGRRIGSRMSRDDGGPDKWIRETRDAAVAKVVARFTTAQTAVWTSLVGRPFTGRVRLFGAYGGFGGFGGGGIGGPPGPPHDDADGGGSPPESGKRRGSADDKDDTSSDPFDDAGFDDPE